MKLIDKSALVAEIERRRSDVKKHCDELSPFYYSDTYMYALDMLDDILSFLDTLEVKEVDLKKEIEKVKKMFNCLELREETIIYFCAKRFFELGLKAKGE